RAPSAPLSGGHRRTLMPRKRAAQGVGRGTPPTFPPCDPSAPCPFPLGSEERFAVLAERARLELPLYIAGASRVFARAPGARGQRGDLASRAARIRLQHDSNGRRKRAREGGG